MAWLKIFQTIKRHRKTKRLAKDLGVSIPTAIGHLLCLWIEALDFTEDGNLEDLEINEIAEWCLWEGDPDKIVSCLVDRKWLDRNGEGRMKIHDWGDYMGRLIERRRKDAEYQSAHWFYDSSELSITWTFYDEDGNVTEHDTIP